MQRTTVEAIARELGAFLIYLEKGKIEAQQMDLVAFSNAIEQYTRQVVVRDVAELLSQYDEGEFPSYENIIDTVKYGSPV